MSDTQHVLYDPGGRVGEYIAGCAAVVTVRIVATVQSDIKLWPFSVSVMPRARRELQPKLHLCVALIELLGDGTLSASAVSRVAKPAMKDGWGIGNRLAQDMANAGSGGKYSGNVQRMIFAAAGRAGVIDKKEKPYKVTAPGAGGKEMEHDVWLSHEHVQRLEDMGELQDMCIGDAEYMLSGIGKLVTEWCAHPDVAPGADPRTVPIIGFHGDSSTYTSDLRAGQQRSVTQMSLFWLRAPKSPLWNRRHTWTVLHKSAVCDCGCKGRHTMDEFMRVLAWDLSFLCGYGPAKTGTDRLKKGFKMQFFESIIYSVQVYVLSACHAL